MGLGHLLLRSNAEDSFDAQPLHDSEAGLVLVADLRLDNRESLADALAIDPAALDEMPDSEILLRAYKCWGADCAAHLLGDFVFAVWDMRRRELVLGRDHLGQRHVFYHRGDNFFAFASEPRGLWALPDVPQNLSDIEVGKVLIFDRAPARGATQFEGIFGLEGGTVMRVSQDKNVETRRYWEPHAAPEHLNRDEAYYIKAYRQVLSEAVACRLRRTTRPAGLFLGGGFDSGAIAGLAGPVVTAQRRKLVAVSSVMPEGDRETSRNARKWVALLARDLMHLDLHYVTREGIDIFAGLEASFLQVDGVRGPDRYANEAIMRDISSTGARVVMDGHGGDYTLNPRARRALLRLLLRGQLRTFLSEFRANRASTGVSYARLALREIVLPLLPARAVMPLDRLRRGLALFGSPEPVADSFLQRLRKAGLQPPQHLPADRLQERRSALVQALRGLQSAYVIGGALHAAAHGMELTQPYHDKRVIELALAIPESLILRNGRDRYLARKALADVLPPEFQTRGSQNDDVTPDFCEMIRRVEPRMLAEIERMEKEGRLARYFDLPRMRRMLTGQYGPWRNRRTSPAVHKAARAFLHARYIEWLQRGNRPEP